MPGTSSMRARRTTMPSSRRTPSAARGRRLRRRALRERVWRSAASAVAAMRGSARASPDPSPRRGFGVRELLGDRGGAGAGRVRAARERGLDGERAEAFVGEERRGSRAASRGGSAAGVTPRVSAAAHSWPDRAVRVAERHALGDQRVGQLHREQVGREAWRRASRGWARARRSRAAAPRAAARAVSAVSKTASLSSCRSFWYALGRPFSTTASRCALASSRALLPRASSNRSGLRFCGSRLRAGAEAVRRGEPAEAGRAHEHQVLGEPRQVQPEAARPRSGTRARSRDRPRRRCCSPRGARIPAASRARSGRTAAACRRSRPSRAAGGRPPRAPAAKRSSSRSNAATCASQKCASSTGCAGCRCV